MKLVSGFGHLIKMVFQDKALVVLLFSQYCSCEFSRVEIQIKTCDVDVVDHNLAEI